MAKKIEAQVKAQSFQHDLISFKYFCQQSMFCLFTRNVDTSIFSIFLCYKNNLKT